MRFLVAVAASLSSLDSAWASGEAVQMDTLAPGTQLYQLRTSSADLAFNNQWVSLPASSFTNGTYTLGSNQSAASRFFIVKYEATNTYELHAAEDGDRQVVLRGRNQSGELLYMDDVFRPGSFGIPDGQLIEWGVFILDNNMLGVKDGSALTRRSFVAVHPETADGGYELALYNGESSLAPLTVTNVMLNFRIPIVDAHDSRPPIAPAAETLAQVSVSATFTMPGAKTTLLIEGTFEELTDEFAQYIDSLKKSQGDESTKLQGECADLLKENKKDDVLKKLVVGSQALNQAPEKEFIAAYNLLIHLVNQSPNVSMFLPKMCQNLSAPISSSPNNGGGLALSILSTIFNTTQPNSEVRYHVLLAILRVIRATSNFETLRPQLKQLDSWLAAWETDEEDARKLYLAVSDVAAHAGEDEQAYTYLLRALRTFPSEEAASPEARELSLRALKSALTHPTHFDFQDLTELDSIQALRNSDAVHFQLLEIFNSDLLDDYNDFKDEHDRWVEESGLDGAALNRKIRLLTLASMAASAGQTRSLPYEKIAKALQVPSEDVEMWVIDVIRAGLVEGKLSQLNQTFLIHRSTYRVFGDNQWREVASRLDLWRNSLQSVLQVIQQEKQRFLQEKEEEANKADQKADMASRFGGRGGQRKQQPRAIDDDLD
ncbi:PCI-domain-containing protein [Decorospora gaudefroyi]|uniref:Eukaryotic translation initiation factor 3 subunit M n=1 Tax=Decorospora gaudefroyi TaxID=184978 RepID=A0A6A5K6E2_9PLEO|nr:PCI-domain-containing protein [Decorospora gaudefroyi]